MFDAKEVSEKIRAFARTLAAENEADLKERGITVGRAIVVALTTAHFDAMRDEWRATAKAAGLEPEAEVARELMEGEGYKDGLDPICGVPGMEAYYATVDGKKAVCYEMSMAHAMPLSALYVNKVRESIDIAARVGELVAKKAEEPGNDGHTATDSRSGAALD